MDEIIKLLFTGLISAGLAIWGSSKFILEKYSEGYLIEKGKNLATKQDVAEITKIVEVIKHENDVILEEIRGYHELRLAAIDKRLEVHQKAFSMWWQLKHKMFREEGWDFVVECQNWWIDNNLYLSHESRRAFVDAYQTVSMILQNQEERTKDNFEIIDRTGDIIVKSVALPSIDFEVPERDEKKE